MNYHNDDEQPGTSAGTDNRREELLESSSENVFRHDSERAEKM